MMFAILPESYAIYLRIFWQNGEFHSNAFTLGACCPLLKPPLATTQLSSRKSELKVAVVSFAKMTFLRKNFAIVERWIYASFVAADSGRGSHHG
jgi:hypothetical protein